MNKNNRKDQLYKAAFKLFLTRPFGEVSISAIEKEANMTRGAIVYYAGSKLELFQNVVKYYFIDKQKSQTALTLDISLKEYIKSYVDLISHQMASMKSLMDEMSPTNGSRAYISLGLNLKNYSEELHYEYLDIRNRSLSNWISVLQRAASSNEIKADIDIISVAEMFVFIYLGVSVWDALLSGLDIEHLKRQYHLLYNLLKV